MHIILKQGMCWKRPKKQEYEGEILRMPGKEVSDG